jgi:CubicO group peptidase (beta-lactamase class C family)
MNRCDFRRVSFPNGPMTCIFGRVARQIERGTLMKRQHRLLVALSILFLTTFNLANAVSAYDVTPPSDPATLGFSPSRLARIAAWQQTQVDAGAFSGAVAAIARNGKVAYLRAVGFRDRAKTIPLQSDAIFWIASMTKPVTSVAAMILAEEGKLDLAAPVSRYLPEFRDTTVAVETRDAASGKTDIVYEPQKRPMIVEDLLRHTAGFIHGVGKAKVDQLYVKHLYDEAGVFHRDRTLADVVSELARLPLAHQPGEIWDYGHSLDVLGRVMEVVSGQPLDQFLEARLFKPLGMIDTGFYVPEAKLSRLVDPPADNWVGPPDSVLGDVTKPTKLFSGGGGLVSTAADYLRLCQMLLNGGELDGVRILSPATVRRMTTNALPPGIRFAGYGSGRMGPLAGSTQGLGVAVRSDAAWSVVPGSVGSFSWMGASGTYFWVDPAEQLAVVQMIHVSGGGVAFQSTLRNLAYGALCVPDQGIPAHAPRAIDQAALATVEGTYRFTSSSARDRQEYPEFGGLGIDVAIKNRALSVVSPFPDMPAAKAGVLSGDVITHVNGEPTQGMDLNQAIEKMRGLANTAIRLKIARKGQDAPIEFEIVRAPIRRTGIGADLQVAAKDGKLQIENNGTLPVLDFEKGAPIAVVPMSRDEFFVDSGDHTRLAFLHDETGKATGLVLNPGPWQITGQRINGPG